jgi:hypothetical protein
MYAEAPAFPDAGLFFGEKTNETNENKTNVQHSLPFSAGLIARRALNEHVGLKTGLIYTYLSTTYEYTRPFLVNGKTGLHYLGIPLDLTFSAWRNTHWEIYFSGGGMFEKGLRLNISESQYQNNSVTQTYNSLSVNGIQWSVHLSAGVMYKFLPQLGWYFEPELAYFFENDQPTSIRTEQAAVFGMSTGLRFEF